MLNYLDYLIFNEYTEYLHIMKQKKHLLKF